MRKLFFYILLFVSPVILSGQVDRTVHLDEWELITEQSVKSLEINYLSFPGAVNDPVYGALPLSSETVDLPAELFVCEPEFTIIAADTFRLDQMPEIADIDLLKDEIQYNIYYHDLSAEIRVLPLVRITEEELLWIREYNMHVEFVPALPVETSYSEVDYAEHSVLGNGTWFKLGITRTGVHRITYQDLLEIGIAPAAIEVQKLGIFGNYNGMLPESNSKARPDDLQENAVYIDGAEDGSFDEGDYILFYARAPRTWRYNLFSGRFDHENNLYTDTTYYFLTTDQGNNKRIQMLESLDEEPTMQAHSFVDYTVVDHDWENLLYSGKEWFGERFTGDTVKRTFTFHFPNHRTERPLFLKIDLATRAYIYTYFKVTANGETVIDTTRLERVTSNSSTYARSLSKSATFFSDSDQVDITIEYISEDPNAITWLNYLVLNAERALTFTEGQMHFMNPKVTAEGNVTRFVMSGADQDTRVWDISDQHAPQEVSVVLDGNQLEYILKTDDYRRFIAFDQSAFFSPVSVEVVPNQDLHAISQVNYVIVSPDIFLDQAERLAQLHRVADELKIEIVTPGQIYNEFSSGSQDVSAIRDFMRMLRNKGAFGDEPAYLLMFGDASFDYKHRVHENNNMVPTYQSEESLRLTGSYVTDDYFGLLDNDEGLNCTGELDIGIGRFPVTTPEQAEAAVDKIEHYIMRDQTVMRDWRNTFCFVADDSDKNL
ncbi:MAG: type IX secretion system sortase PorU, partial [bacterium]